MWSVIAIQFLHLYQYLQAQAATYPRWRRSDFLEPVADLFAPMRIHILVYVRAPTLVDACVTCTGTDLLDDIGIFSIKSSRP